MTSITRSTTLTALAVAITTALVAAPSYAATQRAGSQHKPAKIQKVTAEPTRFSKPGHPYGINLKAPAEDSFDSFIISFDKGSRAAADLQRQLDAVGKLLGTRIAVERTLATGASLVRMGRSIDVSERKLFEAELMKQRGIRAVEPNGRLYRAFEPNDPLFAQQWHYQGGGMGINATEAWDSADGAGYIIAVLDTGQVNHADLAGQFIAGYDFISDPANARDGDGRDADPNDEGDWDDKYDSSWHGTHVAGTVAALTDNGVGVAGVAHGAKVQHVRVLGSQGGTFADINDAIVWASGGTVPGVPDNATPAHIINLSLGGATACPAAMQDAIDIAIANGTTVIAAAGNSSADVAGFSPAGCDGVIAVAGTGPNNTKYARTNYGPGISVAAPAGSGATPETNQVLSTLNDGAEGQGNDSYAWYAGTSMAAPHVAGTAALMMDAAGEALPPDEIETILRNTGYAANGTVTGCNTASLWCASLIDAGRAVAVASGAEDLPDEPPPPPPPPPPTVLDNGVAVEVGELIAGTDKFYTLEIPAGQAIANFDLVPGTAATGDADIYVRYGSAPTNSAFDCRPWTSGTVTENCSFTNPQAGTWHVRVVAYTTSTGYTVEGEYGGTAPPPPPPPTTTPLVNGESLELGAMAASTQQFFVLDVPASATEVEFVMSPGEGASGDSDLYVRFGEAPTGTLYDCRPFTGGTMQEVCTFSPSQAGQYFVRINAWSASNGYSLTGTHNGEGGAVLAPENLRARYVFALKNQQIRVPLNWDGGAGEQVDVKFNGEVATTVDNTGRFTHTFTAEGPGPGSVTYEVCNAGTTECSGEITVNYTAR